VTDETTLSVDTAEIDRGIVKRETLYELVWTHPLTHIGSIFGVSDVAVAKWCQRLGVPRPGRGYWARRAAGLKCKKLPLPPGTRDDWIRLSSRAIRCAREWPRDQALEQEPPFLDRMPAAIIVPDDLRQPHPLVAATRAAFLREKRTPTEVYDPPGDVLAVRVSRTQLDRSLRILQALVAALETAGFGVKTSVERHTWRPDIVLKKTTVTIEGVEVPFSLREESASGLRRERHLYESKLPMPHYYWESITYSKGKGTLRLRAGSFDEHFGSGPGVGDTKSLPLEHQLSRFVRVLFAEAARLRQERSAVEERERREEEERRHEEQAERERVEEQRRRRTLGRMASQWRRSQSLLLFVDACARAASDAGITADDRLSEWLIWARAYAESLDPLRSTDSLLAGLATPSPEPDTDES